MPTNNMISFELTDAEVTALNTALSTIEGILNPKMIALTPEENQLYGKLGNETENFAKMVFDDVNTDPSLAPPHVDKAEWARDVKARTTLNPVLSRVTALATKLDQTNRLLGFDVYNAVSATYNYTKYMAGQNNPGFNTYYDKWKVQFNRNAGRGGNKSGN